MLLNNYFSKKNKLLYKMKIMNSRNQEYEDDFNFDYDRIEKYNDKRKVKQKSAFEISQLKLCFFGMRFFLILIKVFSIDICS